MTNTFNANLNDNEREVMDALVDASAMQGHDFGFAEYDECVATLPTVTKKQFPGYVASLQDKGWIECYTFDPDFENGFEITVAAAKHIGLDYVPGMTRR